MRTLTTIVCDLLTLGCVAAVAKRLQVIDGVSATQAQGDDMIHRQWSLLSARRATTVRRVLFQDSFPFCPRATALSRPPSSHIALMSHAVGFGMSGPVSANDLVTSLSIGFAPLSRKLVQALAIVKRIDLFPFSHVFRVILPETLVAFTLSLWVLLDVGALISRTARSALCLFAVRVTSIGREFVYGFSNLALSAGLVDNRHRSISITDWAMPRLLQQRVAFAFRVFYPISLGATR